MAGFRQHVSFSGVLGLGYGCAATFLGGFTPQQGALAGCLAGVAGMLPDLDSPTGKPGQEIFSLTAAVAPLVLVGRVQTWLKLPNDAETTMVCMVAMYLIIRYGLAALVKRFSVHRGMFHSLPAMAIAAELVYLGYPSKLTTAKLLMGGGVALGFFSHLLLDELWSVQWKKGLPGLKKSSGTAIKMVGNGFVPNAVTFALLATLSFLVLDDAGLVNHAPGTNPPLAAESDAEATGPDADLIRQAALPDDELTDVPQSALGAPGMTLQTPDATLNNLGATLGEAAPIAPIPPPASLPQDAPEGGLESLFRGANDTLTPTPPSSTSTSSRPVDSASTADPFRPSTNGTPGLFPPASADAPRLE
ncbi:MAG: metal-dependent hydrolase [Planctomycetaceae bacterium]|nr:metal-dependent hydrolase [Planctomycetaceae bacterium]